MRYHPLSYFTTVLYLSAALASTNVSSSHAVSSKNVVFGVTFGGSSHINWVLAILDELATRGHNVTFAARDDFTRYGESFERIKTIGMGSKYPGEDASRTKRSQHGMVKFTGLLMDAKTPYFAAEFTTYKALFRSINADVAICDHFTAPCQDAAKSLNIPFIVTSSLAASPDARASYLESSGVTLKEPTTLTMSFPLRFYNRFIVPLRLMVTLRNPIKRYIEARKKVGAPPFLSDPWKDSLKILNTAYGFEPARPLGPLVEMVGPIVQQTYAPLSPHLKDYLDSHNRVVYVAFGQNFVPTKNDIELILGALLDNVERGIIDGFLWATVNADMSAISKSIALPSGRHHNISEILSRRDLHCSFVDRVPQQALLQHPAVSVFLTHGGKASMYESLLSGVRMVAYPIHGDQPFNARTIVNTGLGGSFDRRSSLKQASETLETIVLDVSGKIRANVERYRHLVWIRSARGASKGADLVEEVAFMHLAGQLPHRYEASRQMSYMKSTNLDLYAVLVVVILGTLYGSWRVVRVLMGEPRQASKRKVL